MYFNQYYILWLLTLLFLFTQCKNKSKSNDSLFSRDWKSELAEYEKLMEKDPGFNNFQTSILKISQLLVDTTFIDDRKEILEKGIEWSQKYQNENYALIFMKEYVKSYPREDISKNYLLKIAENLDEDSQELEVKIIYDGILKRWPETPRAKENWDRIKRDVSEFDFFLNETGKKMFGSDDHFKPDTARITQFISLTEAYSYAYPEDKKSVNLLMQAAQVAKSGNMPAKAIELYDWIWRSYPEYPESPLALFLKGFTYETDIKNKEFAVETYTLFIKKYPNHERVKEAQFLLKNMYIPDRELINTLEN